MPFGSTQLRLAASGLVSTPVLCPASVHPITVLYSRLFPNKSIVDPPAGGNVTEWCKKEACWRKIRELEIELPSELEKALIQGQTIPRQIDRGIEGPDLADQQLIEQIAKVSADTWFQIASWAKETSNLQPWQRSLAVSLGRLVAINKNSSRKQAVQGLKILEEAERLGFKLAISTSK
jgi:hypothetical protein